MFQVVRHERFDDTVQLAVDEGGKIVQSQFNAMIGHAILRKVVGANAFVAFAGADLFLAPSRVLGVLLGNFDFQETRAQDGHGLDFVFLLRTLVGAADDHAGGFVNDLHGGVGSIDALTALAGGAADVDFNFFRLDGDIDFLRLGQNG